MIDRWQPLVGTLIVVCGLSLGCSESEQAAPAPTPSVFMPSQSLRDPLTEEDVQTFLSVLQSLPDNKAPEFQPLAQVTASERMTGTQLVDIYRQEYREMFDASRHGTRWRKDARLMSAMTQHDVTPEDFANLMIRLSCAITASDANSDVSLSEIASNADAQVAEVVQIVDQLGATPPTPDAVERRRQALDALQELVARAEFSRMLMEVPDSSCQVVANHRDTLAHHLPKASKAEQLGKQIKYRIVPTSHQQQVSE